jgi:peptide/nickel transport system substrate-binding protein
MALATQYMKKAGYPSGKYTGNDQLLLIAANTDPGKAQAQVAKAQLEKLGLKIQFRTVPQDAVYTEWCQVPAKKVAICGSAGWFKDFTDPQSMLEVTFKGSNIVKGGGNNNLAQLDDPAIDKAMDDASKLQGDERLKAWANIDKMITGQAPAVPFDWDKTTIIWSKDVQGVGNPYYDALDFSYTSLK